MKNSFIASGVRLIELDFADIADANNVANWVDFEKKHDIVKILTPLPHEDLQVLRKRGYVFADRTLEVSIPLNKLEDVQKHIRLKIMPTNDYKTELMQIAQESFVFDRRFHWRLWQKDKALFNAILEQWFLDLPTVFVCFYKDLPVGFLALLRQNEKNAFVHLAAVAPKYRMTGAAMALYAFAINEAKIWGCTHLNGRISAQNMAVMNLYAYFGAKFGNPTDIYIKEI